MKAFFVSLVFVISSTLRAATGDVSVTVNPDGWSATVFVEGFTRGATYAFGFGTDNVPGSSTPYFTVVSLGYDNTGAATTRTRQVYLTSTIRFPYNTVYLSGTFDAGTFVDGETITQATSGATGIIVSNQSSGSRLYFKSVTGTFNNSNQITGGTSGATFTSSSTITTPTLPTTNEQVNSTGLLVQVALSDYIYQKDNSGGGNSGTAPTITVPAAFVTNTAGAGQTSNALSAAAITQNSTAAYPKVVGNWSWPGFSLVSGDFPLRFVAYHGTSVVNNGIQVSPGTHNIACVVFTAADTHSHTATTTVTAPTYDSSAGDAVPVVEFVGTMAVSGLDALDVLTCNAVAYPLVGDSGAVLDTSAGTAQPTPLVGPITMVNDKSNTYGVTCALVDPTGSDGGANTVYDAASFNPATAYKFLTIGKAAAAIASYNNTNHSRNDVGGGFIYLNDGNYNWTGSANTYGGGNADTWLTIQRATTSSARSAVAINGFAGNRAIRNKVKWVDLTYNSATASTVSVQTSFWMDQCTINTTASPPIYQTTVVYVTRSDILAYTGGLRQFGTENVSMALFRGNNFNTYTNATATAIYTVLGNSKTDTSVCYFAENSAAGPPAPVNTIFAYNRLTSAASASNFVGFSAVETIGKAIVQNVLENTNNTQPLLWIGADSSSVTMNNVIAWHNTTTGQRRNAAYNDNGTASVIRLYWSEKNNLWEQDNIKSDTFAGTRNGNRVGNWSQLYGVNHSGNFDSEVTGGNLGAAGSFMREFVGLKTYTPTLTLSNQPVTSGTNAITYISFVDRQSRTQAGAGTGNGDYRLTLASPAVIIGRELLVPYDLKGSPRGADDSAGAYSRYTAATPGWWWNN